MATNWAELDSQEKFSVSLLTLDISV